MVVVVVVAGISTDSYGGSCGGGDNGDIRHSSSGVAV